MNPESWQMPPNVTISQLRSEHTNTLKPSSVGEVFSHEDFHMMDNKDAITNKYSDFTPEAAAMISREHEIRLQS